MSEKKFLVLGGTGEAGICLLRELVHRNHPTVVYARNPTKIPPELSSNPLLEIIKGEMTDQEALSTAIPKSHLIISLLGPTSMRTTPSTEFADYFRNSVFPSMRSHHVRRIFLMGTPSIVRPEDHFSLLRFFMVLLVRVVMPGPYRNIISVQRLCEDEEAMRDIDWTVYRIGGIPGSSREEDWARHRLDGETYVGPVGGKGWSVWQRRGALARWLVDAAESGSEDLIGAMPAVSRLAGSKTKSE